MKILVSGGLFNRAEGLWEEIGADAYGSNPLEALQVASDKNGTPQVATRTINRRKRKKQEALAESGA